MTRMLPLATACLLLALSGVVHGLWTGRWGTSADVREAAARCDDMPMSLGDWEGHATELSSAQLAIAEVVGHCSRHYVNRRTGQEVTIALVCGRPGPISVHTPDVCYAGAGYAVVGDQEHYKAGSDAAADFITARFAKPGAAPDPLRIYWSWSDGGPWSAPDNPRLAFARSRALYKLYVIRSLGDKDQPPDQDACAGFMNVLLPELRRCLSPAS